MTHDINISSYSLSTVMSAILCASSSTFTLDTIARQTRLRYDFFLPYIILQQATMINILLFLVDVYVRHFVCEQQQIHSGHYSLTHVALLRLLCSLNHITACYNDKYPPKYLTFRYSLPVVMSDISCASSSTFTLDTISRPTWLRYDFFVS